MGLRCILLTVHPLFPVLEALATQYNQVMATIKRLERVVPSVILEELIYSPTLAAESLQDQDKLAEWLDALIEKLSEKEASGALYDGMVKENPERGGFLPVVTITTHGIDDDHLISYDFFHSAEYRAIVALNEALSGLIEPTGYFQRRTSVANTELCRRLGLVDEGGASRLRYSALQGPG